MGYYSIDISPQSCDITTIVTGFGKFRHKRGPMGLCAYGDKFKAKADKLLSDIEGVKMYINYVLILGKWVLYQHIDQIRVIFSRMNVAGLKVKPPK